MTTGQQDPRRSIRRVSMLFATAIAAGLLLSLVAPSDWEPGPGSTSLMYQGLVLVDSIVTVGDVEPLQLSGSVDGVDAVLTFPDGIPANMAIRASIELRADDVTFRPEVDDVSLTIRLLEGDGEIIPVVGWDVEAGRLEALRRPPRSSAVVLGLLGFVVVLWVTEAIPLFVTSLLIPVVLVFTGVAGATEATAPFFNPIIVLFFGGFLMAEAMKRSDLDRFIAVTITARSRRSPALLYGAMIGLTAVMSMFMSNTAAAAVLVPIAIAVSAPLAHEGFKKALVLGIAYAATIGGVGSAIGTPANQLAIEFLGEFGGRTISFAEWFAFGLPVVALFMPVMGFYLWKVSGVRVSPEHFAEAAEVARRQAARAGKPTRDQLVVLGVFVLVASGWLTQTWHGVHAGIVALAGAVVLYVLRRLEPEDLTRISWPALLTFGGGLTMGLFIVQTGTSDYLATRLTGLSGLPGVAALLVVALITLLLTTVASNTASAAILIPLAIPLAGVLGMSPTTLVVVVAIASSVDFALVIGTPPTMIAYATRLNTAGQIFRRGVVLDVAGIMLLVLVVVPVWGWLGLA